MEQIDNQLAVIEKSVDVLKGGGEILRAAQMRKDKAIQVGKNIIQDISDAGGMDETSDARAMKYLTNIKQAAVDMKEQRSPVTQIMTMLAKLFTETENDLDPAKAGTIPYKIQVLRNEHAARVVREKAERQRNIEIAAQKQKEAIVIKAEMEANYMSQYNDYLLKRKQSLQNSFNGITLDNYDVKSTAVKGLTFSFRFLHDGPKVTSVVQFHKEDEIKSFAEAVAIEQYPGCEANCLAELNLFKEELVDSLSSKKNELVEAKRMEDEATALQWEEAERKAQLKIKMETANAAEIKKLELEAKEAAAENTKKQEQLAQQQKQQEEEKLLREKEQAELLEQQNRQKDRDAQLAVDIKQQGEETMLLFETEAGNAELEGGPESKMGVKIVVHHPVGYTQIFALWFEHEGKNLPIDKIGNTKLDQMKAWAEKFSQKKGGVTIDSKFLQYEGTVKAINRK